MKVLITGITGFVGSHLAESYVASGHEVIGIIRSRTSTKFLTGIMGKIRLIDGDITDSHAMDNVISTEKPHVIHHLAAQSFVPYSWTNPDLTFNTNLTGSLNILESVKKYSRETVVHVASSSEIYGNQEIMPITEANIPKPISPYAISKLAMDHMASQYHASYGLRTVITRTFNHSGPRRGENFVESKIARHFASKVSEIRLGNLYSGRDWSDVRDIVKAYRLAVEKCEYGIAYNVCSGDIKKIKDIIHNMEYYTGHKMTVIQDPAFMRPSDVNYLLGDCTKFQKITGWKSEIPFYKTCADLVDYWASNLDH